jgi:hypothetical protein
MLRRIRAARIFMQAAVFSVLPVVLAGCGADADRAGAAERGDRLDAAHREMAAAWDCELARLQERSDSFDAIMQPLPLLRPADEAALRRFLNPAQLQRARALGVPPNQPTAQLERLVEEGRLVRIEPSTEHWIVRELDYSVALVTPDAYALLLEIGERFQRRLAAIGLPAYRYEITSVLRSAEDQQRLRQVNPNAAAGVSTHQFGTTFDIAYNAFAAPADPLVEVSTPEAPWLEPRLQYVGVLLAETVAARRARELQAILGHTLIELQNEGAVMVIIEQLQPVYHMTVARRLAD